MQKLKLFALGCILVGCGLVVLWLKVGHDDEKPTKEDREWWNAGMKRAIEKHSKPIRFYGKLVDENGNPVPGIRFRIMVSDVSEQGATSYPMESNKDGLFSLTGVKGNCLGVFLHENGSYQNDRYYVLKKQKTDFYYADAPVHIPDAKSPVIFRLRKKGEAAALLNGHSRIPFPEGSTLVKFNLFTGKASADGNLYVERQSTENKESNDPFDWNRIISVPSGGLCETTDEFSFLAPEEGYGKSFEINMPASLGNAWRSNVEKYFYIVFGEPQKYAKVKLWLRGNGGFIVDYYTNPSGSRNLEFDPVKRIDPGRVAAVGWERALAEAQSRTR